MKKKEIMIDVDNVSMRFNLGIEKGFSLKQWFVDFGKHKKKKKNEFWALKDVDFKINKGEVFTKIPDRKSDISRGNY